MSLLCLELFIRSVLLQSTVASSRLLCKVFLFKSLYEPVTSEHGHSSAGTNKWSRANTPTIAGYNNPPRLALSFQSATAISHGHSATKWPIKIQFGRHGGVGWKVGLDDLRGLFQPMILWPTSPNTMRCLFAYRSNTPPWHATWSSPPAPKFPCTGTYSSFPRWTTPMSLLPESSFIFYLYLVFILMCLSYSVLLIFSVYLSG